MFTVGLKIKAADVWLQLTYKCEQRTGWWIGKWQMLCRRLWVKQSSVWVTETFTKPKKPRTFSFFNSTLKEKKNLQTSVSVGCSRSTLLFTQWFGLHRNHREKVKEWNRIKVETELFSTNTGRCVMAAVWAKWLFCVQWWRGTRVSGWGALSKSNSLPRSPKVRPHRLTDLLLLRRWNWMISRQSWRVVTGGCAAEPEGEDALLNPVPDFCNPLLLSPPPLPSFTPSPCSSPVPSSAVIWKHLTTSSLIYGQIWSAIFQSCRTHWKFW